MSAPVLQPRTSPPPAPGDLARLVRERAAALGFDACGFAPAAPSPRAESVRRWIADGCAADMGWFSKNLERRLDPSLSLPGVRTLVMLGITCHRPRAAVANSGRVARYAEGRDYHRVFETRLKNLSAFIASLAPGVSCKFFVDYGPLLERENASLAGLGWQGKSTMLISREAGAWLMLGAVLTTLDLPRDTPARDRCGSCTRCIRACPTGAITAPYRLDSRRCISWLTIENQGDIPEEFRAPIGDRLFGCDACLDACPWNRFAQASRLADFDPRPRPSVTEILGMDEPAFAKTFEGSPIRRAGLRGLRRNAIIVLGNTGSAPDLPALEPFVEGGDPVLSPCARWAAHAIRTRLGTVQS